MKANLVLLGLLIFFLVLLGLASLHGMILVLAVPLLVYLGAGFLFSQEKVQLEMRHEVTADQHIYQFEPVTVRLTITNLGPPLEEVFIEDILPVGLELVEGKNRHLVSLDAQAVVDFTYQVRGERGEFRGGTVMVSTRESFDLFQKNISFQVPYRLVIRPRFAKVKEINIHPPQTRGFAGPILARQGGSGVNFFSLREYQPGDPLHRINWRLATQTHEELFTNIYEQERVADVGLILDARSQANIRVRGESLFEHSVRATASLAESFLRSGNRVGLYVYGGGVQRIFPGYGKHQQERINESLARCVPGHNYALEDLSHLPTRFFPSGSQIVLISPLVQEDITVLRQLRANGYGVIVVSPDPLKFESGNLDSVGDHFSYRIARTERLFLLQRLRRAGIQLVDWEIGESLDAVMHEKLMHHPGLNPIFVASRVL